MDTSNTVATSDTLSSTVVTDSSNTKVPTDVDPSAQIKNVKAEAEVDEEAEATGAKPSGDDAVAPVDPSNVVEGIAKMKILPRQVLQGNSSVSSAPLLKKPTTPPITAFPKKDNARAVQDPISTIFDALSDLRNRSFVVRFVHTLSAFLEDSEQQAHECDPIDSSFHRLIVHKAAEVCALEHKVESNTKDQKVIVLRKGTTTLATAQVLADLVTATTDTSTVVPKRKVKIMRRGNSSSSAAGDNDDKTGSGGDQSGSKQMSLEEREEEYKKARARIFAGDTTPDEIPTSTSRNSSGGGKQGSNRNSYDASTNRRYNQSYYQRDRTSPQPYQPYYPQYYPPQQYYPQQTLQYMPYGSDGSTGVHGMYMANTAGYHGNGGSNGGMPSGPGLYHPAQPGMMTPPPDMSYGGAPRGYMMPRPHAHPGAVHSDGGSAAAQHDGHAATPGNSGVGDAGGPRAGDDMPANMFATGPPPYGMSPFGLSAPPTMMPGAMYGNMPVHNAHHQQQPRGRSSGGTGSKNGAQGAHAGEFSSFQYPHTSMNVAGNNQPLLSYQYQVYGGGASFSSGLASTYGRTGDQEQQPSGMDAASQQSVDIPVTSQTPPLASIATEGVNMSTQ